MPEDVQPLVLVSNRRTASGHTYADRTGLSYEFPTRYRNLILAGSPFVYYRSQEVRNNRTTSARASSAESRRAATIRAGSNAKSSRTTRSSERSLSKTRAERT